MQKLGKELGLIDKSKFNFLWVVDWPQFEYDKEEEERKLRKAEFEAGEQSGIQKGIQEGIQEGKELKTKEIVNSLLQDGMGIEKIAALLKISKEHVLELAGRSKNL